MKTGQLVWVCSSYERFLSAVWTIQLMWVYLSYYKKKVPVSGYVQVSLEVDVPIKQKFLSVSTGHHVEVCSSCKDSPVACAHRLAWGTTLYTLFM